MVPPLPGWTGLVLPELPLLFGRRVLLPLRVLRSSSSERAGLDVGAVPWVLLSVPDAVLAITDGVEAYTAAAATPAAAKLPTPTAAVIPVARRLPLLRVLMARSVPSGLCFLP